MYHQCKFHIITITANITSCYFVKPPRTYKNYEILCFAKKQYTSNDLCKNKNFQNKCKNRFFIIFTLFAPLTNIKYVYTN